MNLVRAIIIIFISKEGTANDPKPLDRLYLRSLHRLTSSKPSSDAE